MSEQTVIFWFSGTGNSFHVAERLATNIPGGLLKAVVSPAPVVFSVNTHVILVAPVYAWGLPAAVSRFVDSLSVDNIVKVSLVLTFGGAPGGAVANAAKQFRQLGVRRVDAYSLKMVDNYPPFGGAPKPEKAEKQLLSAEYKLSRVIKNILANTPHPPSFGSRFLSIPSLLLTILFRRGVKTSR